MRRAIFVSLRYLSAQPRTVEQLYMPFEVSRNNKEARAYHADWRNSAPDEDRSDRRFLRSAERGSQRRVSALSVEAEMHGRRGRFRVGTNTVDPVASGNRER